MLCTIFAIAIVIVLSFHIITTQQHSSVKLASNEVMDAKGRDHKPVWKRSSIEIVEESRIEIVEESRIQIVEESKIEIVEESRIEVVEESRLKIVEESRI